MRALNRLLSRRFVNWPHADPKKLKILTFNTHEGYNYDLAKTGHSFDVVLPATRGSWPVEWDLRSRPLPPNVRIIGRIPEINLRNLSGYDVIVAQTLEQFDLVEFHPTPKVLLFHTTLSVEGTEWPSIEAIYENGNWRQRLRGVPIVYVSDFARDGWGLPGRVIEIGLDPRDYELYPWKGEIKAVLTVSHFFRERAQQTGFEIHQRIIGDDIPFKIVGHNPQLPNSGPAASWGQLRGFYAAHAVYLDPSGGSMAGLEAAAVGMPVVKIRRSTGHHYFTDGHDAYLSADPERLRADVLRLIADHDLARAMGEAARRTVARVWGIQRFVAMWQEVFADAVRVPHPKPLSVGSPTSQRYFRGSITVESAPTNGSVGELAWAKVRVRNDGSGVWHSYTQDNYAQVRLAYRWLTPSGDVVVEDGDRTPLPLDLRPGDEVCLNAAFRAPSLAGTYLLEWDLVCEFIAWFSNRGNPTVKVPITVVDRVR